MLESVWREKAQELANYFSEVPDSLKFPDGKVDISNVFCAWIHLVEVGRLADATILEVLVGRYPDRLVRYQNGTSGELYDRYETPRLRIIAILRDIAQGTRMPEFMRELH